MYFNSQHFSKEIYFFKITEGWVLPLITDLWLQFWGTGAGRVPLGWCHGGLCLPSLAEGVLGPDSGMMCGGSAMLGPDCGRQTSLKALKGMVLIRYTIVAEMHYCVSATNTSVYRCIPSSEGAAAFQGTGCKENKQWHNIRKVIIMKTY